MVGNSLKFTLRGSVTVALEHDEHDAGDNATTQGFRIRVEDTGIGMSQTFQDDSLFTPFRQENRFEPGVGLGLSIVRRIVKSLGGSINVRSKLNEGTSIEIGLSLPIHKGPHAGMPQDLRHVVSRVKGKHLAFIDAQKFNKDPDDSIKRRGEALREVATNWLGMHVSGTMNLNVSDADFYLYSEPPPAHELLRRHQQTPDEELSSGEVPLIIVATDSKEAHMVENSYAKAIEDAGRIVEVLAQPCGPRKLAKVLRTCLERQAKSMEGRTPKGEKPPDTAPPSLADDPGTPSEAKVPKTETEGEVRARKRSTVGTFEGSHDLPPPLDNDQPTNSESNHKSSTLPYRPSSGKPPQDDTDKSTKAEDNDKIADTVVDSTKDDNPQLHSEPALNHRAAPEATPIPEQTPLHGLLVDDNRVNLRLLVTLMKKAKYSHGEAENGQEALDKFKSCSSSDDPFDFILMDIGMPVLNGMEATKLIREHEREHNLQPTKIIALTAWADTKTQEEAMASGMDLFIPKPVKFKQLREILGGLDKL